MRALTVVPDQIIEPVADLQACGDAISVEWRKTLDGIFGTGRRLIEAKERLPFGQFGRLFVDSFESVDRPVPFTSSMGRMLMDVASDPTLTKRDFSHDLPPVWRTLYYLRDYSEDEMALFIEEGLIRPDMTQAEARALRHPPMPKEEKPIEGLDGWLDLKAIIDRIGLLGQAYADADTLAATVPPRRRRGTAKKLRDAGTTLGRVAVALERLERHGDYSADPADGTDQEVPSEVGREGVAQSGGLALDPDFSD